MRAFPWPSCSWDFSFALMNYPEPMIGPAAHLQGLFFWPGLIDLLGWSWDLAPADIPTIRAMMDWPAAPLWGLFLAHGGQGLLLGRDQGPVRPRTGQLQPSSAGSATVQRMGGLRDALHRLVLRNHIVATPRTPHIVVGMYTHRDNPRGIYVSSCSSRRCRRARTSSLNGARS
jgi:hypothetical protein